MKFVVGLCVQSRFPFEACADLCVCVCEREGGGAFACALAYMVHYVCVSVIVPPFFPRSKQLSRTRSSESLEPWRRRDVPRAGRPPRRRAARGRPSGRPSAARRGAGPSAVPAGASPRRVATMPEVSVPFASRSFCASIQIIIAATQGCLHWCLHILFVHGCCFGVGQSFGSKSVSLCVCVPRASEVLRGQGRKSYVKIQVALNPDLWGGIVPARNSRVV